MSASRTVTRIVDQDDAVAGKVPVALGGTGAGDAATARANLGLGTVATHAVGEFLTPTGDGSGLTGLTEGQVVGLTSDLAALSSSVAAKAPLASPALTGTPTAPTAALATNTTQIATTAFVMANAGGGTTAANPTAVVGLTAVNGTASTYLRSDGAPALSQSIVPTWTGAHTFSSSVLVNSVGNPASTGDITISSNNYNIYLHTTSGELRTDNNVVTGSTGGLVWTDSAGAPGAARDTGIKRVAKAVVGPTAGTAGVGWLQNTSGRARLTADATNATATMSALTDLSVTLAAGRKYTGRLVLFASNSAAAEGLAFDFNGGTATTTSFKAGFAATPPGSGLVLGTLTTAALATALTVTTATTGDAVYSVEFSLVCNAAGTFVARFSEISHTSGTATVRLGSYVWIEDMPA